MTTQLKFHTFTPKAYISLRFNPYELASQPALICSRSIMETTENWEKFLQIENKDTKRRHVTGFGYIKFTKSIFQGSIITRSHFNTRGQSVNTAALARMYFAIAKIPHRLWERAVSIQVICDFFHSTFYHYIIFILRTHSFFFVFDNWIECKCVYNQMQ